MVDVLKPEDVLVHDSDLYEGPLPNDVEKEDSGPPALTLDDYQEGALDTRGYPGTLAITYPALGLAGEVGEVCELLKKAMRDDGGLIRSDRHERLLYELGDVLWYLAVLASDLGLSLGEVAQANLDKLADRKRRNVIRGDGSNR